MKEKLTAKFSGIGNGIENAFGSLSENLFKTAGTAALITMVRELLWPEKEEEKEEKEIDILKIVGIVLLVLAVIAAVCGVIFAIVRFLQPKEETNYSVLPGSEEDEEDSQDDPDIAEEFDKE